MIDGLNVARAMSFHGGVPGHSLPESPKETVVTPVGYAQALAVAIDHFVDRGFEVHAILPVWALDGGRRTLISGDMLLPYVQREMLHLSPTGTNDDDFILQLACSRDAYVLTNDLFRDHILQGRVPKQWVAARRISYMYVHKQILTVMPSQPTEASRVSADGSPHKRPCGAICKRPKRIPRHGNRPGGACPGVGKAQFNMHHAVHVS